MIFGWQQGALREVSRTSTEFWLLAVRPGTFHSGGLDDVYTMGTLIWGDIYPRPRIFNGTASNTPATADISAPGRGRAFRPLAAAKETAMQLHASGDCVNEAAEHWSADGRR